MELENNSENNSENKYDMFFKKKMISRINKLTKLEHIEILKILNIDNVPISENMNGILIKFSLIKDNTLISIDNFLNYLDNKNIDLLQNEEKKKFYKKT
jgi:hypothetical protein